MSNRVAYRFHQAVDAVRQGRIRQLVALDFDGAGQLVCVWLSCEGDDDPDFPPEPWIDTESGHVFDLGGCEEAYSADEAPESVQRLCYFEAAVLPVSMGLVPEHILYNCFPDELPIPDGLSPPSRCDEFIARAKELVSALNVGQRSGA